MSYTKTNTNKTSKAAEVKTAKTTNEAKKQDYKNKKEKLAELRKISKTVNPALKKLDIINRNLEKLMGYDIMETESEKLQDIKEYFTKKEAELYNQIPEL